MRVALVLLATALCLSDVKAQGLTKAEKLLAVGDSIEPVPTLAKLPSELKREAIRQAMSKVADWQVARVRRYFNQDWTFAALYVGLMAASETLDETEYEKTLLSAGESFHWRLGPRVSHADDQAIGQTYLELYQKYHDSKMIEPLHKQFDELMKMPDDPAKPIWWWSDALFMAPPVWARLYKVTGDIAYLDYMDREWWITSGQLYDPEEHLFFRDASYMDKRESNRKKVFWSRGNGWVMAGLMRVLESMPKDYPTRPKYVEQFQQMASRIAELQEGDGLWRPGLLNAHAYPLPETSGSAFFVYALSAGVNQGILDRSTYLPVVRRGWKGLVSHIYSDGRLGCIQPVGAAPGEFMATSSFVFGVGAFLAAGSEVDTMAAGRASLTSCRRRMCLHTSILRIGNLAGRA